MPHILVNNGIKKNINSNIFQYSIIFGYFQFFHLIFIHTAMPMRIFATATYDQMRIILATARRN